jgi:hypothetical protein
MAGCAGGNCLRSHVDMGETYNALAMITKAGVPSHKITVGIASYGRQFKMTDPNCSHANCTYVGPEGAGTPGRCTDTPEYISLAEIKEIIRNNPSAKVTDAGSSKALTYDGNWVSYMDDNDKIARTSLWKSMNFGGVTEWAIDLNTFDFDDDNIPGVQLGGPKKIQGMRSGDYSQKSTVAETCHTDNSWRSVKCPGEGEDDLTWTDAKADGAWCAALTFWKSGQSKVKESFPSAVAQFLGLSLGFQCEKLVVQNGCTSPASCRVAAASPVVLRSMANINQVSVDPYGG